MTAPDDPDRTNWLPMLLTGMLVGSILVVLMAIKFRVAPAATEEMKMSYADMAAVVLTGVSVMVAVLAVFVGALAIWGYSQFGKVTENASRKHLEKLLRNNFFKDQLERSIIAHVSKELTEGELRKIIVDKVEALIVGDASARDETHKGARQDREFED